MSTPATLLEHFSILKDPRVERNNLHRVSAWACRNAVVPGQVKTEEKSNEIVAIAQLE